MSRELVRLFRAEIVSWVLGTCLFHTLFPSKSFGTMFFYMKMCENPSIFQAKKSRGQPPVPGSSFRCLLRLVFCGMASRPQIYFFGCRRRHSVRASRSFSSHRSGSNETRMYLSAHIS